MLIDGRCSNDDLVQGPLRWVLWGLPMAAVALGCLLAPPARTVLWSVGFAIMGAACLANARGCRRRHCFVTGPLYLTLAALTLLRAGGVVSLAWPWIPGLFLAGTLAAHGYERACGTYARIAC